MKIILKGYINLIMEITNENRYEEADAFLYEYGKIFKQKGWKESLLEGGILSPDGSALFVTSRSPYNGQLLSLSEDKISEFNLIVEKLLESEDFVKC